MSTEDVVHLAAGNGTPVPVEAPTASATCASCGAPLAPDQRYCLACGQPASPVRLAFLDVLQGEYQPAAQGVGIPGGPPPAAYYTPPPEPDGLLGALRRYSGLLALVGVLLASLLIGLLVGHWITGGNGATAAAGKQVIEVKGLSGLAAAAPAPTTTTTGGSGSSANHSSSASGSQSHHSPKEEAKEEAKEVAAAKAPPPVQKKTNPTSLQKLDKTTGKQHVKEVNEQFKGNEPIETGH
jgi:predicted lipid-binding transport protein (Tim44 family)